jgi:hypothetical protein
MKVSVRSVQFQGPVNVFNNSVSQVSYGMVIIEDQPKSRLIVLRSNDERQTDFIIVPYEYTKAIQFMVEE